VKSYILWDHDGVLVETEPWYFHATRQCIRELGIELDQLEYLQYMALGRSAWEIALARGASEAQVQAAKGQRDHVYQQLLVEQDIEIPGVTEVLSELSAQYAMAIVTTAKRSDFELIHRDPRITRHMEFVLASGDYPRSKPHPDPYIAALEKFGAVPEEALVVEDSERGLRAAIAAGIDCAVVANSFVQGQDFSAATYRLGNISELPGLLATL